MKKLLLALLVLVAVIVVVGLILPGDYRVERSLAVKAPLATVHGLAGELKSWPQWMPWWEEDPTIQVTYGEKTTGEGARHSWTGADGDGEVVFTRCDPESGVDYDMVFIDGESRMPSRSKILYEKVGDEIKVTWTMEGTIDMPVVGGYMALFMDGSMVGPYFERGLAKLKSVAEKGAS